MTRNILLFIISLLLIVFGCSRDPREIDVSGIQTDPLKLFRLEDDLFAINENNIGEKTRQNLERYGPFYEHYIMTFLNRGGTKDSAYKKAVLSYVNDKDVREAYDYIKKGYP